MHVYTVHEAPDAPADRLDRAERLVFVREGFVLAAALVPPLWMLGNRMWLAVLGYVTGAGLLGAAAWAFWLQASWVALLMLAVHLLIGFEADGLKRWSLARAGWQTLGTVSGRTAAECERRFFEAWMADQPMISASRLSRFEPRHAAGAAERRRWALWRRG